MNKPTPEDILEMAIKEVCGIETKALGGVALVDAEKLKVSSIFSKFLSSVIEGKKPKDKQSLDLYEEYQKEKKAFTEFYSQEENREYFDRWQKKLINGESEEERAEAVTHLFLPELALSDEEVLPGWRLDNVEANPEPFQPDEIIIQLNALYAPAETYSQETPQNFIDSWKKVENDRGEKIADYDHPVALFEEDEYHETVKCLDELNDEMAFEKEQKVIANDYRFPVVLSISVTHPSLDKLCGEWLDWLLAKKHYQHLRVYILNEDQAKRINQVLGLKDNKVFTVFGKYARHFNALKYFQLLMEKTHNIRAGFKLDTDEGVRSRDLHKKTGKTWLQTCCHSLWGGTATDAYGDVVYLGINEGEYVNNKDILKLGYKNALRTPDVAIPSRYQSPEIFFNKAFAHGRMTALYNQFDHLEDHISHPVVKGGGYGISNEAIRQFVPFTFSEVGRAEDQQFYFYALSRGCRGIFHPDLRIAHYKGEVAKSENKTAATRFIGDMYRLIIFQSIVAKLGIKQKIDPMPGVFSGSMARLQALLNLSYRAMAFEYEGDSDMAETLLYEGIPELKKLKRDIDNGTIEKQLEEEEREWKDWIAAVNKTDRAALEKIVNGMML